MTGLTIRKKEAAPFETRELRRSLKEFLSTPYPTGIDQEIKPIEWFKWGVYIFYDYDGEPIYVGQTKEKVSGRISRHLTNQRTDAVAMSVLDPYEVYEIEVFPIPGFQHLSAKDKTSRETLDALEFKVHQIAVEKSKFGAILNEKDPPNPVRDVVLPRSVKGRIVSDEVRKLRGHPDTRTARRAQVVARLAQTISERDVKVGLRRTLFTQTTRLQSLAGERFEAAGGAANVEKGSEGSDEEGKNRIK
ncbi:MAG: GIY-YIG nuclease family protein [Aestuariivirga sp.]|nr:GIY-YIG nuclease family protein [Aestuariivirga sp.]